MSNELPRGWAIARISDIAETRSGGTPSTTKPEYWKNGDIPWINSGALKDCVISEPSTHITRLGSENSAAKLFPKGTVVIALTGATTGRVGILAFACSANQSVTGMFPTEAFLPFYLFNFLRSARPAVLEMAIGSAQPHINKRIVDEIEVPLAPLAEQRRIVAKLEQVLGKVESCQRRLAKIPALLKRFRQSVLAAACSGRLTADWREKNPDIQPAASLIKDRKFNPSESASESVELPDLWCWEALGNYGRCFRGRFTPRPRNDPRYFGGKHPFIQIGNLPREGGLVSSHTQTLNDEGLAVSRKFPKGTVVIAIVGATIGNTGILAYDMCVTDSLVGIETGTTEGNHFIEFYLRHKKHDIREASYSSGGQPNIKLESLNPYPIPLPPFPEQQEIVRRVEALFALADRIEARYAKAQTQVDRLTPSLLARAFAGKLVPQDPADEPASALLERIRRGGGPAASAGPTQGTAYPERAPRELKVAEARRRKARR